MDMATASTVADITAIGAIGVMAGVVIRLGVTIRPGVMATSIATGAMVVASAGTKLKYDNSRYLL